MLLKIQLAGEIFDNRDPQLVIVDIILAGGNFDKIELVARF